MIIENSTSCSIGSIQEDYEAFDCRKMLRLGGGFAFAALALIGQSALGRLDANLTQLGFRPLETIKRRKLTAVTTMGIYL